MVQGTWSPYFVHITQTIMNISDIIDAIQNDIVARKCFLVDAKLSKDNKIILTIESEDSIVSIDDCVYISRCFESKFNRDIEDYELTVSSAGLDKPFKVFKQFQKAVGKKVEVALKGGRKLVGKLMDVQEDRLTLKYSTREAIEGKKKKELVEHIDTFSMEEVNTVKPHIEF